MNATALNLPETNAVIAASLRTALAVDGSTSLVAVMSGLQQITALENPIPIELLNRSDELLDESKDLIIDCQAMRDVAGELVRTMATMKSAIETRRLETTRPFDAAKKSIMGWVAPVTDRLDQAIELVKGKIIADNREQQRIAAEAQRKADAEAAAERARIAAAAAAQAAATEAAAKKLRDEAAAAAASGDSVKAARLEQRAESKEEAGAATVQALHTTAAQTVAHVVAPVANRVAGVSTREKWNVSITSKIDLIRYVAEHPEQVDLLDVNLSNLKALAKVQKTNLKIPGVQAYDEGTVSARKTA